MLRTHGGAIVAAKPDDGPIADFCAKLKRLVQRSGLEPASLVREVKYGKSQFYAILDGNISRPPNWDRLVYPLVWRCTGGDTRQIAHWKHQYDVLTLVFEELQRRRPRESATGRPPAASNVAPEPGGQADASGGRGPGSVWRVPPRISSFVPRAPLAERIRTALEAGPVALCGMGGVGKSRLAAQHAHEHASAYDIVWWIDAEQDENIGGQLAELAVAAGACGPATSTPAAVERLGRLLREWAAGRWLLIFDNADSPEEMVKWLPAGPGHTLFTSRNPGWAEIAAPLSIDVFSRTESRTLLTGRVTDLQPTDSDRLAAELGDLPLALAQAAALITTWGISPDEYLAELARHASTVTSHGRPPSYPRSLAATVAASTARLGDRAPLASRLLEVCVLLAPEVIPHDVLRHAGADLGIGPKEVWLAVEQIGRSGLARVERDGVLLHRLTSAIIRDGLAEDTYQTAYVLAQRAVGATAPDDSGTDPAIWPLWQALIPHALALRPAQATEPLLRDFATRIGRHWLVRGQIPAALRLSTELRDAWTRRYGPNDRYTLAVAVRHVMATIHTSEFEAAIRECRDVLARMRHALGPDDPETLNTENVLAMILRDPAEGYEVAQQNLANRRRVLGPDHPDTLWSTQTLASYEGMLGRPAAARDLARTAWTGLSRVLGDGHPWTHQTACNLADHLRELGELEEAYDLLNHAIEHLKKMLAEDEPDILTAQVSFALILAELGRGEEAVTLAEDAVSRMTQTMGADHPWTVEMRDIAAAAGRKVTSPEHRRT